MALERTKRVFKFGDKILEDPGIHMTPEEVMEHYARLKYPSLTKGEIAGPFLEDGEEKYKLESYEIKGSYGTKG